MEFDAAWARMQSIAQGSAALLPNLALGLAVFTAIYLAGLGIGRGVAGARFVVWPLYVSAQMAITLGWLGGGRAPVVESDGSATESS